jgi:hypothetical protein
VAKNRDGILNRGVLNFYAKCCRFEESARVRAWIERCRPARGQVK